MNEKTVENTVETMNAGHSDVFAPRELCDVAVVLQRVAADENDFADYLCNETAANFTALMAQVETCREALAQIEVMARRRVAHEAKYHRENLQSIEALDILKAA